MGREERRKKQRWSELIDKLKRERDHHQIMANQLAVKCDEKDAEIAFLQTQIEQLRRTSQTFRTIRMAS